MKYIKYNTPGIELENYPCHTQVVKRRVVSLAGLFGLGSGLGRVQAGFGPKVDKNFGLNSDLRRADLL